MKNAPLTFSIFLSFMLISFLSRGQSPDVIYLRIAENAIFNSMDSYIQISYSDGKQERIELEKLKPNGSGAMKNGEIISGQVKKLLEMGYSLHSQSSGGTEFFQTVMVFIRQ